MKINYDWEYELYKLKLTEEEKQREIKTLKAWLCLWLLTLLSAIILLVTMFTGGFWL